MAQQPGMGPDLDWDAFFKHVGPDLKPKDWQAFFQYVGFPEIIPQADLENVPFETLIPKLPPERRRELLRLLQQEEQKGGNGGSSGPANP